MNDSALWEDFLNGNGGALNILMDQHAFRIAELSANSKSVAPLVKEFLQNSAAYLGTQPSFLHWLYLIARREVRFLKTGYLGWDGLFESNVEIAESCESDFKTEMSRQLVSLTDERLGRLKMKFEDGLWFEEAAVKMEAIYPSKGTFKTAQSDWLLEWKQFQELIMPVHLRSRPVEGPSL